MRQTSSNDLLLVCVCVVTMRTAKEQTCQHRDEPADRYDNSYVNLGKQHLDFLESMVKAIHLAYIRDTHVTSDKVKKLVRKKTAEWCAANKRGDLFDTDALKAHKKLWDCMRRDKYGVERELEFRMVHQNPKARGRSQGCCKVCASV